MDMRRNDPERTGIKDARDVIRGVGRNAHEGRNASLQGRDADLCAGFERETRMLHVDVERVKAGSLRDARDLTASHQPHGHRGNHFVALKLFLEVVAHEVCNRHALLSLVSRSQLISAKRRPMTAPRYPGHRSRISPVSAKASTGQFE
jgi:hypothetical protein